VISAGGIDAAAKIMEQYLLEARQALDAYPPSIYKDALIGFTHFIGEREK
jgi:geranylgeranyl pyrophosphate synthase